MQGIPQHYPATDAQMRGPARAPRQASEDFAAMLAALDPPLTEGTGNEDAALVPAAAVEVSGDEAEAGGDVAAPDATDEGDANTPTGTPAVPEPREGGTERVGDVRNPRGSDAMAETGRAHAPAPVGRRDLSDLDAKTGQDVARAEMRADHRGQSIALGTRAWGSGPLAGSMASGRDGRDGPPLAPRAELRSGMGEGYLGATQTRNGPVSAARDMATPAGKGVKAQHESDDNGTRGGTRARPPRHMTLATSAQTSAGRTEMKTRPERREGAAQMTHPGSLGAARMSGMADTARAESLLPIEKEGANPAMRDSDVFWRSPTSDMRAPAFSRPAVAAPAPCATPAVWVPDSARRGTDALQMERDLNAVAQIQSTASRSDSSVPAPSVTPGGTPLAPACLQIIEAVRQADQRIVHLQLAPAELGRVRIMLSATESGLQIVVTGERAETMELLRRNSGALMRELSDLGFDGLDLRFGEDRGAAHDERDEERLHSADASPASAPGMELPAAPHNRSSNARLDLRC